MGRRLRVDHLAVRLRNLRGASLPRGSRPAIPPGEVPARGHACRAAVRRTARAAASGGATTWPRLGAGHAQRGTDGFSTDGFGTGFTCTDHNGIHCADRTGGEDPVLPRFRFGDGDHVSVDRRYEAAPCYNGRAQGWGHEAGNDSTHTEDTASQLIGRGGRVAGRNPATSGLFCCFRALTRCRFLPRFLTVNGQEFSRGDGVQNSRVWRSLVGVSSAWCQFGLVSVRLGVSSAWCQFGLVSMRIDITNEGGPVPIVSVPADEVRHEPLRDLFETLSRL
jgi:hypothetical protein